MGIIVNHYKDPYYTIRIQWKLSSFFRGSHVFVMYSTFQVHTIKMSYNFQSHRITSPSTLSPQTKSPSQIAPQLKKIDVTLTPSLKKQLVPETPGGSKMSFPFFWGGFPALHGMTCSPRERAVREANAPKKVWATGDEWDGNIYAASPRNLQRSDPLKGGP